MGGDTWQAIVGKLSAPERRALAAEVLRPRLSPEGFEVLSDLLGQLDDGHEFAELVRGLGSAELAELGGAVLRVQLVNTVRGALSQTVEELLGGEKGEGWPGTEPPKVPGPKAPAKAKPKPKPSRSGKSGKGAG